MNAFKKCVFAFALVALAAMPVAAQTRPVVPSKDAKLILTVTDQTAGVLPGATVTVTGLEDATKGPAPIVARTADRGVVTVEIGRAHV